MSESQTVRSEKTPLHLWLVGIVGFLWSLMGAMDYVMTQTRNEEYMSAFTAEQLSFFYSFPSWVVASWAIAVWSGVIGSIFLLFRKRIAVCTFLVSFIAMIITAIHNYGLSNGFEVIGDTFSLIFTTVIFLVALGLYLYAKAMKQRGIFDNG